MRSRILLTSFLIFVYGTAIFGYLIIAPVNRWATSTPTTMGCSSSLGSNAITWYHTPVNQSVNVTIASGSTLNPSFTQLYEISQRTTYESSLIIRPTNASRGGTFTCSDKDMFASAQLLVFNDIRTRHNASGTLIIGDVITYFCQMVYLGNPYFEMLFYLNRYKSVYVSGELMDNTTSPQLEISNSTITSTVNFYQIASCLSYETIQCFAYVTQPIIGSLLPNSATNVIEYAGMTSGYIFVNVQCVPSITGAASGSVLCFGATLSCQLTSKLPVNYSWIDLTYGNSTMGSQLSIWHYGSYQCNASFAVSGLWQTVSATVYNLTVQSAPSITGAVSGSAVYLGATLTCQLTSNLSVNYSWIDLTFRNSSIGPQLIVWHGGSYQCNASFIASGRWQLLSATVYNLTVESAPSITGAVSGVVLFCGTTLSCQLTSTLSVNYSWIDLTYGNSSIGPRLTVWHGGSYQCDASFVMNGRWQSVSATVYNLTVENLSSAAKPLYGPIAGGTNVTLTLDNWSTQIASIAAVYFGGILKATSLQSGRLSNSVVLTTPNTTAEQIDKPLTITIEFTPGPYNISTNLSFTYRGNPEITGINPSTFVFTGGTIVTVTGTRLSSVANPLIQITLVVERGVDTNTTELESCEVKSEDGSEMTCRMPRVNIPDDFLQVLDLQYTSRSKRDLSSSSRLKAENPIPLSRHKRYTNALSVTGPNGLDQAVIYLGFILDGYQKYNNINNALPDTQILIFSPPEISFTKDVLKFDPDKDDHISIKGKHMMRGCRTADYVVEVGSDICKNIDLTDNQLRCRPPKQQPQSNQNTSFNCDELLSIYIHLGFKTYQYACMKYSSRLPVLIIGLAVGLSSFVIVILLIIGIVCCCKRSRNRGSKATNNNSDLNTDNTNDAHEPSSDQLYANQIYSRPTVQSLYINEGYETPSADLYANALELKRV